MYTYIHDIVIRIHDMYICILYTCIAGLPSIGFPEMRRFKLSELLLLLCALLLLVVVVVVVVVVVLVVDVVVVVLFVVLIIISLVCSLLEVQAERALLPRPGALQ